MSLSRRNPRRDQNETSIRQALGRAGAESWPISGKGLPDLLVCDRRGRWHVAEIKTARGKLTIHQGRFPVWRSAEDALKAIGAMK